MATPTAVWGSVRTDLANAGKVNLYASQYFSGAAPQAGDVVIVTSLTGSNSSTTAPTVTASSGWVEHYTDSFLFYGVYSCVVKVLSKVLTQADVDAQTVAAYVVSGETAVVEGTIGYGVRGAAYASLGFAGQKLTDGTTNIAFPALSAPAGSLVVRPSVPMAIDAANVPNTFPDAFPAGWTRFGLDDNNGNGDNFPAFWHPAPAPLATATTGQVSDPYRPNIGFTISLADTAAPSSTTVSYGITNTADDVIKGSDDFFPLDQTGVGNGAAYGNLFYGGLRFVGVAVPQGATITSATLTLKKDAANSTAGTWGSIKGVNSDNAPAWTITGPLTASKTTQSKTIVDGATQAYDVAAIVQAIVGRAGWSSGGALAFVSDPTGSTGLMAWVDYATSPADCAQLSITYTTGGAPAPTLNTLTLDNYKFPKDTDVGDTVANILGTTQGSALTLVEGSNPEFEIVGTTLKLKTAFAYELSIGDNLWADMEERLEGATNSPNFHQFQLNVTAPRICEFVAAATGTTTPSIPAHVAGDLIVLWLFRDGNVTAPALPSGFTSLITGSGNTTSFRVAYRVATAPGTSGGGALTATSTICHVYRPAAGYALSMGASARATGSSVIVSYPALTLQDTSGPSWVVGFTGHRSTNTALELPPTGMVARSNVIDTTDEATGCDTDGGVSSWPLRTVSVGGTASGWISATVEIRGTPAGLTPITGSASAALAALTLSATGAVMNSITGSASATLGVLTASGAGAPTVTGQRNGAVAPFTASAAGSSPVTGQASRTLAALTLAASGVTTITGSASAIIATLTVSAAGETETPGTEGAANLALASLTLTASGGPTITGAGSAQIGPMALVAVGAPETTGQGSLAVTGLTVSAQGALPVSGQVSGLLAPMAVEAEGESAVTGAGSGLFSATAAAVGVSAISGAASALLGQLTVDAFGAAGPPPIEGSASIALASLTVVASGEPIVSGAAEASVSFSASAAGITTITGAGSGLVSLSLAAVGSLSITGEASAAIWAEVEAEGEPIVSGAASTALGAIQAEAEGYTTVSGVALAQIEPLTLTAEGTVRNLRIGRRLVIVVG